MNNLMKKLNVSLLLVLGLSSMLLAQNNPPSAVDFSIDITDVVATEILLNGSDADNDAIYFPMVSSVEHGFLASDEDTLISGVINNLEAGPPSLSYWMFDQDGTPFEADGNDNSVYAFTQLNWNADGHGNGTCDSYGSGEITVSLTHEENLSMVDGVYGITPFLDSLKIASHTHVNTENPDNLWNTMGEAGDIRIYNMGVGGIKDGNTVKLAVVDLTLWLKIYYPATVGAGGVDGYADGFGVGTIDVENSDPAWVAEFDPNGTGFVEIAFESFSNTVQACYGSYDVVGMSIQPMSDNVLSYTPDAGYYGTDNFSYVVYDGQSFSDEIQVTLNVGFSNPVGEGTWEAPYQIEVLDDLLWISQHSEHWDAYYIQIADIDASSTAILNDGLGFSPIGTADDKFTGYYDGQGFTIDGLTINRPNDDNQGLFGYAYGGNLDNLGLTNVDVTGGSYTGGLVGYQKASINGCYTTGTVTGLDYTGGLSGIATSSAVNCYSESTVSGATKVGGLIGHTLDAYTGIHNSYSTGAVSGSDMVGGLIGNAWSRVENSYATGQVSRSAGTAERLGGFIGYTNDAIAIKHNYSTGAVTYPGDTDPTDKGFVGYDSDAVFWDNFYDMETSAQLSGVGAVATSTADMKTYMTYANVEWDFEIEELNGDDDDWDIDNVNGVVNNGYPFLSWENGDVITISPGIAPEVADMTLHTGIDEVLEFILAGTDPDSDELFYTLWDWNLTGSADLVDSVVTYTPPAGYQGTETFQYQAYDGFTYTDLATITITVSDINLPPVAIEDGIALNEDVANGFLMSMLASDAEGDELTFTLPAQTAHGTIIVDTTWVIYVPNLNYHGADTLFFEVSDAYGSDEGYFSFWIYAVNDAPEAAIQLLPAENENIMNPELTLTWEAATDVDGDDLSYSIRIFSASYDSSYDVGSDLTFTTSTLEMPRGISLEWTVEARDTSLATLSESFHFTVDPTVGIDERDILPEAWALNQNYPNPFNPSTTISFSVPNTSAVRITIYDVSGREINKLVDAVKTQGNYSIIWNGTDYSQNAVSSGMYLFRLEGEGFSQIRRMLYLK